MIDLNRGIILEGDRVAVVDLVGTVFAHEGRFDRGESFIRNVGLVVFAEHRLEIAADVGFLGREGDFVVVVSHGNHHVANHVRRDGRANVDGALVVDVDGTAHHASKIDIFPLRVAEVAADDLVTRGLDILALPFDDRAGIADHEVDGKRGRIVRRDLGSAGAFVDTGDGPVFEGNAVALVRGRGDFGLGHVVGFGCERGEILVEHVAHGIGEDALDGSEGLVSDRARGFTVPAGDIILTGHLEAVEEPFLGLGAAREKARVVVHRGAAGDDTVGKFADVDVIAGIAARDDVDRKWLQVIDRGFAHLALVGDGEFDVGFDGFAAVDEIGVAGAGTAFAHLIDALDGDFGVAAHHGEGLKSLDRNEGSARVEDGDGFRRIAGRLGTKGLCEVIHAAKKAGGNDADGAQDDGSLDVKLIHAIAPSLKSRTRTTATKLRTTMQGRAMMCHFFQRALAQPG